MKTIVFFILITVATCCWAIGKEAEPVPEQAPEPVSEEEVAEPVAAPEEVPVAEPVIVAAPQTPRRPFSLVLNGENQNADVPPIARIDLTPRTTEEHTVQLNAWFEIQVSEGRWYSIPELVQLLR